MEEIILEENIEKQLLSYQIPHLKNIIYNIRNIGIHLDGSDTGTGKTYCAIALAKQFNMNVFCICPLTIIRSWIDVAKIYSVEIIGISNYEKIIKGKYFNEKGEIDDKFVKVSNKNFSWSLPKNTLIIFDEVHRCSGNNTFCNNLLMSLYYVFNPENPLLLLSATLTKNPERFTSFGSLFKWYKRNTDRPNWIGNEKYNIRRAIELIEETVFPRFGSRIQISELGDLFPKNTISAICYDIDEKTEINEAYNDLKIILLELEKKKSKAVENCNGLDRILKARQKIEILKIPIFIDLTRQYLENNHSVIIFTNFTKTLEILSKKLGTKCLIYGEQTIETRYTNINNFMENKEKIIICNINAGSESISLDDKYGENPRVTLINPTWSATKLIQAFGRTCRSDSKSPSKNIIVYCAGTIEEKICNKLNKKISGKNEISIDNADLEVDL